MVVFALALHTLGCKDDSEATSKNGYVNGWVRTEAGEPLRNVRIIIDHSIFFNSNITASTNEMGEYKVKVPNGSWYAFAQYQISAYGENYKFYMSPTDPTGFGGEGGVRNFTWKLTGTMPEPLSGYFGGLITLDNLPGVYIPVNEIEFQLNPRRALIDGSQGEFLRLRTSDNYQLHDVPIGQYTLTATYNGKPVMFREWNTNGAFRTNYDLKFKAQVPGHCDNCAKLEYYWEP